MYSRNLASFLALIVRDGELAPDWEDEIVAESAVTRDGKVLKEAA
jgi:NAD(P) transhydrogenase subunit alpha